ncbi:transcription factor 24 [Ambystoma mexicanum]|uniref:transcription factor 24 n=1 Tax=Ambystoma mexicanum TaxID=8296 RepID=UPI0037E94369
MVEKVKAPMTGVGIPALDDVLCKPSASSNFAPAHCSGGDPGGSLQSPPVPGSKAPGAVGTDSMGRPAAANAARERSRVQTLRHAFLELQRTLPSVPPDTKLSKLDVLILATTYIAHLTRSLQEETDHEDGEKAKSHPAPGSSGLLQGALQGDGYLHPVKKWPMRSRLYTGASGQFLNNSSQAENRNPAKSSNPSRF